MYLMELHHVLGGIMEPHHISWYLKVFLFLTDGKLHWYLVLNLTILVEKPANVGQLTLSNTPNFQMDILYYTFMEHLTQKNHTN